MSKHRNWGTNVAMQGCPPIGPVHTYHTRIIEYTRTHYYSTGNVIADELCQMYSGGGGSYRAVKIQ